MVSFRFHFDTELPHRLRVAVNEKQEISLKREAALKKGKTTYLAWDRICAIMDRLEDTISYINSLELGTDEKRSAFDFYEFISCAAVVIDCIRYIGNIFDVAPDLIIGELPFDIKSYRANEYSLQFNKLPALIEKLRELLSGAIDNTTRYGNPVSDYLPDYFISNTVSLDVSTAPVSNAEGTATPQDQEEEDRGYLDYISDIQEYAEKMTNEINAMSEEMQQNNSAITAATNEINRVKTQSGNVDATFIRNICRKISSPTELFASQIKGHTKEISQHWNIIENSYLSLLDNQYAQTPQNLQGIKDSMNSLESMQNEIKDSNEKIEGFVTVLRGIIGMERKLNKAITSLIVELESYLCATGVMVSSIDRIISKGKVVIDKLEEK